MALGQPRDIGSQAMHCQRAMAQGHPGRVRLVAHLLGDRFYAAKYRPPLRVARFRRCEIKARI